MRQGELVCHGGCFTSMDGGASTDFASFRLVWRYNCVVGQSNCNGSVEIDGDGRIFRTSIGVPDAGLAMLSPADLDTARGIFTAPALVQQLDSPTDCSAGDGEDRMTLVDGAGTHGKVTTACLNDAVATARTEGFALAAKYLP